MRVCKNGSIFYCGRLDFIYIHHFEKLHFIAKLSNCNNIAVSTCYKLFSHSNELKTLNWFYDVPQDYSMNSVKGSIYQHFQVLCNLPN